MQVISQEMQDCLDEKNLFTSVDSLDGDVVRQVKSRKTMRFECAGKGYYAKVHYGIGWLEIVKDLLQLRLPILSASNEWLAIHKLQTLDIKSMSAVAFCREGWNPAQIRSCIVTQELGNTISLEDFVDNNMLTHQLKRKLTVKLATIARRLHDNGVNHRDFYICHFLLDLDSIEDDVPLVYLIDLHRVQIRNNTPFRWRVKDVGGLFFSLFDAGITRRDIVRFVSIYSGKPARQSFAEDANFWQAVLLRAKRLYLQDHKEVPAWVQSL